MVKSFLQDKANAFSSQLKSETDDQISKTVKGRKLKEQMSLDGF